jgi:hypothetical protein
MAEFASSCKRKEVKFFLNQDKELTLLFGGIALYIRQNGRNSINGTRSVRGMQAEAVSPILTDSGGERSESQSSLSCGGGDWTGDRQLPSVQEEGTASTQPRREQGIDRAS